MEDCTVENGMMTREKFGSLEIIQACPSEENMRDHTFRVLRFDITDPEKSKEDRARLNFFASTSLIFATVLGSEYLSGSVNGFEFSNFDEFSEKVAKLPTKLFSKLKTNAERLAYPTEEEKKI